MWTSSNLLLEMDDKKPISAKYLSTDKSNIHIEKHLPKHLEYIYKKTKANLGLIY